LKPQVIIEILDAAHLTSFIESPFPQRGGIMIVGPPGAFKTTMTQVALLEHPSALFLSDLNINSLMSIRESLVSGRYRTIVFPEYEKLYQRRPDTAANIEGTIKQLVEEGFTRASFEEQDAITYTARVLVIGAMTYSFYSRRLAAWRENGFKRRFLWCGIKLSNPDRVMHAIREWQRIELDGIPRRYPSRSIPFEVSTGESRTLEKMMEGQWEATPYVLIKKILAVLKWKYPKEPSKPMEIIREFSECINNRLGVVEI
jgi:hypothetical protein